MSSRHTVELSILCDGMQAEELRRALNRGLSLLPDAPVLRIPSVDRQFRLDPSVLVAIVGVSGTALGALVSELLKIAQQKGGQTIVLQGKDGSRLEIPAGTSSARIDELVDKVRKMVGQPDLPVAQEDGTDRL